jgi:hypothetical protein
MALPAPTADAIITRVRALLQDEQAPYRYSDAQLFDSINDAQDSMVSLRPDYFIAVDFDPVRVVATTTELAAPWRLVYPMTLFVAGYMMLREDEFADDGRAAAMVGRAATIVTEAPGQNG